MKSHLEDMPHEIETLANLCVTHVKNRFGFELDFGIDTLSVLDGFIAAVVMDECEGSMPPPGDRRRSHLIHLLAPTVGAYWGEVLRRQFGGRWRFVTQEPPNWILEFDEFFLRMNPAGTAASVVMGESVEEWKSSLVTSPELMGPLVERLAVAPPLPEDQFYTLTTIHETIQIAEEYLRERAAKDGSVGCTQEDYDRVFGV